jgi:hypothetical protein
MRMSVMKALRSRFAAGLVVGGLVAYALGALTADAFYPRKQAKNNSPFLTEGFDFNLLRSSDVDWRGPSVGEKIDLTRLAARDGKGLAGVVGKRPFMLVAVNPDCAMCKIASDEMLHLRAKLAAMNIDYYVVSFAPQNSRPAFFDYTDSLTVGAPSFLWNAESGAPPESIFTMTTPTHLLLNGDGTVIRVWPGSYRDLPVRQRMARQIVADTAVAVDTLSAVSPEVAEAR